MSSLLVSHRRVRISQAKAALGWGLTLLLLLGCGGCRRSATERNAARHVATATSSLPGAAPTSTMGAPTSTMGAPTSTMGASSATSGVVSSSTADRPGSDLPHYFPNTASSARKRPLLLFLHGYGANGAVAFEVLRLAELGQKYQIFVLAPDGTKDSQNRRFWNAHPACCNFESEKHDHVRYLSTLVDRMIAAHPVDPSKIYVVGFSNGGFMAHRLACEWGGRLRGIVSVAGAGPDASLGCKASKDLRMLQMHGDADRTVFYAGGTLFDRPGVTYDSAMGSFTSWGKRLGCEGEPTAGGSLDLDPKLPGEETTILTYRRCARGMASLWTVHGGSHMIGNRPSVMEKAWLFLNSDPA